MRILEKMVHVIGLKRAEKIMVALISRWYKKQRKMTLKNACQKERDLKEDERVREI